jgi:hypothetical protein
MAHSPPLPPWLADLPRLDDFPHIVAPANSEWKSHAAQVNPEDRRSRVLGARRRCWICGYPITRPYAVVAEGGAADTHFLYPGGLYAQLNGPTHRSCAVYASIACPYLKYSTSRRKASDHRARGRALIVGFNHYGLFSPPGQNLVLFGYLGIAEEIPFHTHKDIAAHYDKAVAADATLGFTTTPRLYWTDSPHDQQGLRKMADDDERHTAVFPLINGYRMQLL